MANADRISEVYKGAALSRDSQRQARERIDWLVAQASGTVLDVGCSQGMASVLCARRGLNVLGVDTDPHAIAYARAEQERKPPQVRERLEFRVADAAALDAPDDAFDTVLVGDVLAELDDAEPLLAEVARVCRPGGVIAITTPFGLRAGDDPTGFYLTALIGSLGGRLTIESVEIIERHFRAIARPGAMSEQARLHMLVEAQTVLEEAVLELDRELHRVKARRRRVARRARTLKRRLTKRGHELRRARWALAMIQRSRWYRVAAAFARLRRQPRRVALLPRDLARALRKQPLPPKPVRRHRSLESKPPPSSQHAELTATADHELRVEIPAADPPTGRIARPELTVAVILDRFSSAALDYEWRQVQFGPDDWRNVLEQTPPDLLFVESAWRGNDDRWRDVLGSRHTALMQPLVDLVGWCRERGIPTVFWNKEDPPHFGRFVEKAALFDHVFTVDGDCVPRYCEILGHERVDVLPFGAQPKIHNPIAVPGGRMHDVAFAGTYFSVLNPAKPGHPRSLARKARREQTEMLLGAARDFDLHIFSRVIPGSDEKFDWPPEYHPYIVGSLPYERMLAAYKAYKVFLNVNSVTASPTMCARRIFELSACSTPVLSGYSRAIEEMFADLITVARTPDETRAQLTALLGDPDSREHRAHRAMREVLSHHTYGHRIDQVLARIGLPVPDRVPSVSALLTISDPSRLPAALAQVGRQAHRPLELVLVWSGDGDPPGSVSTAAAAVGAPEPIVVGAGGSPGARMNAALDAAHGDMIAVFDQGSSYDEHYLGDLLLAFDYTEAVMVGKAVGREHEYVDAIDPATLVTRAEVLRELRFDQQAPDPVSTLVESARSGGARIYSADRFSFGTDREPRQPISASAASGARSGS